MYRNSLILLILLLVSSISLQAQQLAVKSFRSLPHDMDALQNYPLKDQNGEVCAIVKVVTPEKGFRFDIGSLGIMKTEQQTGEIWVYMPHGAKRISIFHDKLGVVRDYFFTERIDQGVCYELELVSGKVVTTVEGATLESQWVLITAEPADAMIFLNDRLEAQGMVQKKLMVGKYTYRVETPMYHSEAGAFELTVEQKKEITCKLKPNFGFLQISSSPEQGATIFIDDKSTGLVTPVKTEALVSGEHWVKVVKEQYNPVTRKVLVSDDQTTNLDLPMEPNFAVVEAFLPANASFFINQKEQGKGNWQGRLTPGVYTLEARLEKHHTVTQEIAVEAGQPRSVTLQPRPMLGQMDAVTVPPKAVVRIGEKEYGTTPLTVNNLLVGDYTVELTLPGYATTFEKVTIAEGETATLNATLQNGRQVTISSIPTGASLLIDGKPAGTTPYNGSLTFGSHTLRIEQSGKQAEKKVTISKMGGETDFSLSFGPQTFTETVKGVSFKMVAIKGGTFQMGSNDGSADEKPVHSVTVSDFYMGETEVTQALWKSVMGSNPFSFKGDNLPVETVSWNDAQEFITKLNRLTGKNYRLPTEAEWEYAAGGGSTNRTKWAGTNSESSLGSYAWYDGNSKSQTHPVGTKSPNGLGLYDMSGNVYEWCSDWKGDYSSSSQTNPQGPSSGSFRVFRGGSWIGNPSYCRAAFRYDYTPDYRDLGFRVVLAP